MRGIKCFLLASLLLLAAGAQADEFSSVAASSYDGSLWMAGDGGIVRVGRNGRVIKYGEQQTGAPSVTSIVSDRDGNIWILGSDGIVRSYSFLDGFVPFTSLPAGVSALASDLTNGFLYASTNDALYCWTPGSSPEKTAEIQGLVTSIVSAPGGTLWLQGPNVLYRLEKDSVPVLVSESIKFGNVSKSLYFEIETKPLKAHWRPVLSLFAVILIAIVALLFGCAAGLYFRRRMSPSPVVADSSLSLPSPEPEQAPEPERLPLPQAPAELFPEPAPETQQDNEFVSRIKQIIDDNIATPKFGVDDIAAITGLSRIHLNRKLKASGCPSPSLLLKDARMKLAASLVSEGSLSFQEIAVKCDFSSASYFTTAFHDYFGVTPSEYSSKK